ncbi:hypothetical protein [Agarivorans aestuarii]|uniref:hypothetical protein n=1 Tax=Agarivorans aestuarii TaxID=1563703 RepID=UPI001C7E8120|nr:hypothetical protein [Agarivorans aestuarii]
MLFIWSSLLTIQLASASPSNPAKPDPFVMYSNQVEDSSASQWLTAIYKELFKRLDIPLVITYLPEARATKKAVAGSIDGQFGRVYEYQDNFPNQIRIDVPLYKININAYSHTSNSTTLNSGWASFKNTNYTVVYKRGALINKLNLEKVLPVSKLGTVTSIRQGLLKVKYGRVDMFVQADIGVRHLLNSEEFKGHIMDSGNLDSVTIYPYIHSKHRALADELTAHLRAMKDEGLLMHYCLDAFSPDTSLCEGLNVDSEEDKKSSYK